MCLENCLKNQNCREEGSCPTSDPERTKGLCFRPSLPWSVGRPSHSGSHKPRSEPEDRGSEKRPRHIPTGSKRWVAGLVPGFRATLAHPTQTGTVSPAQGQRPGRLCIQVQGTGMSSQWGFVDWFVTASFLQLSLPFPCLSPRFSCDLPNGLSGKEFACKCRRCRRLRFDP